MRVEWTEVEARGGTEVGRQSSEDKKTKTGQGTDGWTSEEEEYKTEKRSTGKETRRMEE